MDEIGECGMIPTRAMTARGDQPTEAHALQNDVQRQSVTLLFQYIVDFLHRRAAFYHNLWTRIIRKIQGYFVQLMDIDQNPIGCDQVRPRMTRRCYANFQPLLALKIDDLNQVVHMLWIKRELRLAARRPAPIFPNLITGMADVHEWGNFRRDDFLCREF